MPEVHVLGKIKGATGFASYPSLSLVWRIECDPTGWSLLNGSSRGRTHSDVSMFGASGRVWDHPLDVHFAVSAVDTWPKLHLEVWGQDEHGREDIAGYGMCYLPSTPGEHMVDAVIWAPRGSTYDRIAAYFLGGTPRLQDVRTVVNEEPRFELSTVSAGRVHVNLTVMHLGFAETGVHFVPSES